MASVISSTRSTGASQDVVPAKPFPLESLLHVNSEGVSGIFLKFLTRQDLISLHQTSKTCKRFVNANYYGLIHSEITEKVTAEYIKEKKAYGASIKELQYDACKKTCEASLEAWTKVKLSRIGKIVVNLLGSKNCLKRLFARILLCFCSAVKKEVRGLVNQREALEAATRKLRLLDKEIVRRHPNHNNIVKNYHEVMKRNYEWRRLFVEACGGWKKFEDLSTYVSTSTQIIRNNRICIYPQNARFVVCGTAINQVFGESIYSSIDFLTLNFTKSVLNADGAVVPDNVQAIFLRFFHLTNNANADGTEDSGWAVCGNNKVIAKEGKIEVLYTNRGTDAAPKYLKLYSMTFMAKLRDLFERLIVFKKQQEYQLEIADKDDRMKISQQLRYFPEHLLFDPGVISDMFGGWERFLTIPLTKMGHGSTLTNANLGLDNPQISYKLVRGENHAGVNYFALRRFDQAANTSVTAYASLVQNLNDVFGNIEFYRLRTLEFTCTQPEGSQAGVDKVGSFARALNEHLLANKLTYENCGNIPKGIVQLLL